MTKTKEERASKKSQKKMAKKMKSLEKDETKLKELQISMLMSPTLSLNLLCQI